MSKDFWTGYIVSAVVSMFAILFLTPQAKCVDIESIIIDESIRQGLDPQVALAIAQVESSLNPAAVGKAGEVGLFQLRPQFVEGVAHNLLFDAKTNTRYGVKKLLYYREHCPTKNGFDWVQCYNAGLRNPKYPQKLPYYKKFIKVLGEK